FALALDAFAIAAQVMIGFDLGAGTPGEVRATVRRLVGWGVASGVVFGAVLAGVAPWLGYVFSSDAGVIAAVPVGAWLVAATMPLVALVFVLDGVPIGAADGRYLALRSEEHTSELQSRENLVCRLLLEKKNQH